MFSHQGYLKKIKPNVVKPAKMDAEDWDDLNTKAVGAIWLFLSDQIMYHVMDETPPEEI